MDHVFTHAAVGYMDIHTQVPGQLKWEGIVTVSYKIGFIIFSLFVIS